MIRVAVLSFWHVHGKDYARDADEHPETEVAAIWDELPERGRAEAEKRNVPFYASLDELLAQPSIDGVIVTTPTVMHRDVMVAAARAGKHIFTEKVIAATLREAEEILAEVARAGVTFMVSLRRVTDASSVAIKQIIESGQLGDLTLVRVRDSHNGALPTPENPRGFLVEHFFNPAESQGGAMIDLCHPMYLTRSFLGMPTSVSATYGAVTGRPVEDNAVVTLRYPSGAIGVVETGFVARYSPFSIEVHGSQGSVLFHEMGIGEMIDRFRARAAGAPDLPPEQRLFGLDGKLLLRSTQVDGAKNAWLVSDAGVETPPTAFSQWVAHIKQGTQAAENIQLGLDLTALVEAANRSAATDRAVAIASLERAGG
jgi:1,5-anhydro-D-fructose reductase (1,5-anhydro-D-mannitol-forming)